MVLYYICVQTTCFDSNWLVLINKVVEYIIIVNNKQGVTKYCLPPFHQFLKNTQYHPVRTQ